MFSLQACLKRFERVQGGPVIEVQSANARVTDADTRRAHTLYRRYTHAGQPRDVGAVCGKARTALNIMHIDIDITHGTRTHEGLPRRQLLTSVTRHEV